MTRKIKSLQYITMSFTSKIVLILLLNNENNYKIHKISNLFKIKLMLISLLLININKISIKN